MTRGKTSTPRDFSTSSRLPGVVANRRSRVDCEPLSSSRIAFVVNGPSPVTAFPDEAVLVLAVVEQPVAANDKAMTMLRLERL